MNTKQRTEMLDRYDAANIWLTRVYDPQRSDDHRAALWNMLMDVADDRLKTIIVGTRLNDEACVNFWNTCGRN